jgi:hypothetical protein
MANPTVDEPAVVQLLVTFQDVMQLVGHRGPHGQANGRPTRNRFIYGLRGGGNAPAGA